jgi:ribosomal protein L11 methyltransferase
MDLGNLEAQLVEAVFTRHGAVSVTLTDAADDPVLEPAPGETPLWSSTRISGLFAANTDLDQLDRDIRESFGLGEIPGRQIEDLADRDWEREWLRDFRPMSFGRRLWICPSGFEVTATDAITVHLDPGLAFGSGTHATTAMCLEWLDEQDLRGKTLLDYGCGSGILSVSALCLGAESATGIDIDKQAVSATRINAERNAVSERLTATDDDRDLQGPFDIIVANILAGPLVAQAERICTLLKSGGSLALSGILCAQADHIIAAYRPWIDFAPAVQRDDWLCLYGRKR